MRGKRSERKGYKMYLTDTCYVRNSRARYATVSRPNLFRPRLKKRILSFSFIICVYYFYGMFGSIKDNTKTLINNELPP